MSSQSVPPGRRTCGFSSRRSFRISCCSEEPLGQSVPRLMGWSGSRSTCPYCSVSCGVIIYTIGDRAKNVTAQVVHVEGDPDHPINRGTLCPKGSSLQQDILNDRRLLKPQVRRPGGTDWEDISWDQAISEIAGKVKKTRDDTFVETDATGRRVNRCESIAFTGGCTDT